MESHTFKMGGDTLGHHNLSSQQLWSRDHFGHTLISLCSVNLNMYTVVSVEIADPDNYAKLIKTTTKEQKD